jgi:drug/metabolite transporter (DMT)-like permease
MSKQTRACFELGLAMVLVGSSVVAGKVIVEVFPIHLASFLRYVIALLVLFPFTLKDISQLKRICFSDWTKLILMSFCGQMAFSLLLLWGLMLTNASDAGIITGATPAFVALVAWVVLKEKMTCRVVLGVGMSLAGIFVISGQVNTPNQEFNLARLSGDLLIAGAVLSEALFLLLKKTLKMPFPPLFLASLMTGLGVMMFSPMAMVQLQGFDFNLVDNKQWLALFHHGVFITAGAYILWFRGVGKVPGTLAGVITSIMPLSAVLLSILFLNEPFTWSLALSGVLILGAILTMTPLKIREKAAFFRP